MKKNAIAVAVALVLLGALGTAYAQRLASPPKMPDIVEGTDGWLFPGWDRLVEERPDEVRAGVEETVKQVKELEKRGAKVVVVLVPNKTRVHADLLPQEWRKRIQGSKSFQQLADELRAKGLNVVATWPTFYKPDAHWTAESAEDAADKVAVQLQKYGVKPVNGGAHALGPWKIDMLYGDLVEFLRSKGDNRFAKSEFKVRSYTDPPKLPPTVIVLGNSFVNRFLGFPQKLSNALGVPVKDQLHQRATGPWTVMDDFLKSPDLPAKYIVWVIQETSFTAKR